MLTSCSAPAWRRIVDASIGRTAPELDPEDMLPRLLRNAMAGTLGIVGWVVALGVTLVVGLAGGRLIHSWQRSPRDLGVLLLLIPIATAAAGAMLSMLRAAAALSAAQRIALGRKAAGPGTRATARLTDPTLWGLAPQLLIGLVLALALRPH